MGVRSSLPQLPRHHPLSVPVAAVVRMKPRPTPRLGEKEPRRPARSPLHTGTPSASLRVQGHAQPPGAQPAVFKDRSQGTLTPRLPPGPVRHVCHHGPPRGGGRTGNMCVSAGRQSGPSAMTGGPHPETAWVRGSSVQTVGFQWGVWVPRAVGQFVGSRSVPWREEKMIQKATGPSRGSCTPRGGAWEGLMTKPEAPILAFALARMPRGWPPNRR